MYRYLIADPRSRFSVIWGSVVVLSAGVSLYAVMTEVRPIPNRLISAIVYYSVVLALFGAAMSACAWGFTYRWCEITDDALVIHKGHFGIILTARLVPKAMISDAECFVWAEGTFSGRRFYGVRVRLTDGRTISIAAGGEQVEYLQKAAELRRALAITAA